MDTGECTSTLEVCKHLQWIPVDYSSANNRTTGSTFGEQRYYSVSSSICSQNRQRLRQFNGQIDFELHGGDESDLPHVDTCIKSDSPIQFHKPRTLAGRYPNPRYVAPKFTGRSMRAALVAPHTEALPMPAVQLQLPKQKHDIGGAKARGVGRTRTDWAPSRELCGVLGVPVPAVVAAPRPQGLMDRHREMMVSLTHADSAGDALESVFGANG